MLKSGVIFNIQRFSVNDGPGIRTTVFLKGCPLACGWCHNPEEKHYDPVVMNGKQIGTKVFADEIIAEIEMDRVFYEESDGGVTFSGGEPLAQHEFLLELLTKCKALNIHTTVDTSGYADKSRFKAIMPVTDLFLYDIKFADPVDHLKYTGVSNSEIFENLRLILRKRGKVIIRVPMIPGITATGDNIISIIRLLIGMNGNPEINLLPFHKIADSKYKRFGLKNVMTGIDALPETELELFRSQFEKAGFITKIGG